MKKLLTILIFLALALPVQAIELDDIGYQSTYLQGCNRIVKNSVATAITYTTSDYVKVTNLTTTVNIAEVTNDHYHSCIQQDTAGYYHLVYGARPDGMWYTKSQRPNSLLFNTPQFINTFLTYPIFVLLNDKPALVVRYGTAEFGRLQFYDLSVWNFPHWDMTVPSNIYTPYPADYYLRQILDTAYVCTAYNNYNIPLTAHLGIQPNLREYPSIVCTDGQTLYNENLEPITITTSQKLNPYSTEAVGTDGDSLILPEQVEIELDGWLTGIKDGTTLFYGLNNELHTFECSEDNFTMTDYPSVKTMSIGCDDELIIFPYEEEVTYPTARTFNVLPHSTIAATSDKMIIEHKAWLKHDWNLIDISDRTYNLISNGILSYFHPTIKGNSIIVSEFSHTGDMSYYRYDGILENARLAEINYLTGEVVHHDDIGTYPVYSKFTNDFLYTNYVGSNTVHLNFDEVIISPDKEDINFTKY